MAEHDLSRDEMLLGLDYDARAQEWVCQLHHMPNCVQTETCSSLPWEEAEKQKYCPFVEWVHDRFDFHVAQLGTCEDFPAYSVSNWLQSVR